MYLSRRYGLREDAASDCFDVDFVEHEHRGRSKTDGEKSGHCLSDVVGGELGRGVHKMVERESEDDADLRRLESGRGKRGEDVLSATVQIASLNCFLRNVSNISRTIYHGKFVSVGHLRRGAQIEKRRDVDEPSFGQDGV